MVKNEFISEQGELSKDILLNIAEILTLRMPEGVERITASKWVKKFAKCDPNDFKQNLSLFIHSITKQVLVEPFNYPPLDMTPTWINFPREYSMKDINRGVRQRIFRDSHTPPYQIEISQDMQEYVAFQEIPLFGAHFYYAFSPNSKINTWRNFDTFKVPQKYIVALEKMNAIQERARRSPMKVRITSKNNNNQPQVPPSHVNQTPAEQQSRPQGRSIYGSKNWKPDPSIQIPKLGLPVETVLSMGGRKDAYGRTQTYEEAGEELNMSRRKRGLPEIDFVEEKKKELEVLRKLAENMPENRKSTKPKPKAGKTKSKNNAPAEPIVIEQEPEIVMEPEPEPLAPMTEFERIKARVERYRKQNAVKFEEETEDMHEKFTEATACTTIQLQEIRKNPVAHKVADQALAVFCKTAARKFVELTEKDQENRFDELEEIVRGIVKNMAELNSSTEKEIVSKEAIARLKKSIEEGNQERERKIQAERAKRIASGAIKKQRKPVEFVEGDNLIAIDENVKKVGEFREVAQIVHESSKNLIDDVLQVTYNEQVLLLQDTEKREQLNPQVIRDMYDMKPGDESIQGVCKATGRLTRTVLKAANEIEEAAQSKPHIFSSVFRRKSMEVKQAILDAQPFNDELLEKIDKNSPAYELMKVGKERREDLDAYAIKILDEINEDELINIDEMGDLEDWGITESEREDSYKGTIDDGELPNRINVCMKETNNILEKLETSLEMAETIDEQNKIQETITELTQKREKLHEIQKSYIVDLQLKLQELREKSD